MTVTRCSLCRELFVGSDGDVPTQALEHYLTSHPDSDLLADVLSELIIEMECRGCESRFRTPVTGTSAPLRVRAYCNPCTDADPWKRVIHAELTPHEVISRRLPPASSTPDR